MLEPKKVNCFHCQKLFIIKYVRARKSYSQKNNWGYWTGNEEYENLFLCDDCLVKLYKQHKWEFKKLISDQKKRRLLAQYILSGAISGRYEDVFIINRSSLLQKKKKNSNSFSLLIKKFK